MTISFTVFALVLGLCGGNPTSHRPASQDDALLARFRAEAPDAWKSYAREASRLQGKRTLTSVHKEDASRNYSFTSEIMQNANCIAKLSSKNGGEQSLTVANATYAFRLHRKSANDEWLLDSADDDVADGLNFLEKQMALAEMVRRTSELPLWVCSTFTSLEDFFFSERCTITAIAWNENNGRQLVKIDFEYDPDSTARYPTPTTGGTILLDPQRSWLPVRTECRIREGGGEGLLVETIDYGPGELAIPTKCVRQVFVDTQSQDPDALSYEDITTLELALGAPPNSDFTLAKYGLEEMEWVIGNEDAGRTYWWIWLGISGLVIAMIALYLARRNSRIAATASR